MNYPCRQLLHFLPDIYMDYFENAMSRIALLDAVQNSNMRRVKAALAAGANVNGSLALSSTPIMAATLNNDVGMVSLLLDHGANPDRPSDHFIKSPKPGKILVTPGERALHLAARRGNIELVNLLQNRARADPNAIDSLGRTPLMMACTSEQNRVPTVRLLLKAGADPTSADNSGFTALHLAARHGHTELVDMLYTGAPSTLTALLRHKVENYSPLAMACIYGHESMASRLISLGAVQRMTRDEDKSLSLATAVKNGLVETVRRLLKEGMGPVRDPDGFPSILKKAVCSDHTGTLRLLLMAQGKMLESLWANAEINGMRMLHFGAAYCCPDAVEVLLEAGADEGLPNSQGALPRDVIGSSLGMFVRIDRGKAAAIRRMLARGAPVPARGAPVSRVRLRTLPAGGADGGSVIVADALFSSAAEAAEFPEGSRIFPPHGGRSVVDR